MKKLLAFMLTLALGLSVIGCGGQGAGETSSQPAETSGSAVAPEVSDELTIATLAQVDAWPIYNALKEGKAKDYGFATLDDKALKIFDSGMEAVEGIPAGAFSIGDVGTLPAIMAALRFDSTIVGVAADESAANAIVARDNSPVFQSPLKEGKGFGSAESVKGKTFLMTSVSSSHYVLQHYLAAVGLTEKDVVVKTMEQQTAIKAFDAGEGDFLVLWAPNLYQAYAKGYKDVVTAQDINAPSLMLYIAPKAWAKDNAKEIAAFLAMTSKEVETYQSAGADLAPQVASFFLEYGGYKMSNEDAASDIARHRLFTAQEQLDLIKSGQAKAMLQENATYFANEKKITAEELKTLVDKDFNLDATYLEKALEFNK